jgi:hypothetical protein
VIPLIKDGITKLPDDVWKVADGLLTTTNDVTLNGEHKAEAPSMSFTLKKLQLNLKHGAYISGDFVNLYARILNMDDAQTTRVLPSDLLHAYDLTSDDTRHRLLSRFGCWPLATITRIIMPVYEPHHWILLEITLEPFSVRIYDTLPAYSTQLFNKSIHAIREFYVNIRKVTHSLIRLSSFTH